MEPHAGPVEAVGLTAHHGPATHRSSSQDKDCHSGGWQTLMPYSMVPGPALPGRLAVRYGVVTVRQPLPDAVTGPTVPSLSPDTPPPRV